MLAVCVYGVYRITQRNTVAIDDQGPMIAISARTTAVMTDVATDIVIEQVEEEALEAEEDAEESYERHEFDDGDGDSSDSELKE